MVVDAATFTVIALTRLVAIHPRIRLHRASAEPWRGALAGTATYLRRDRPHAAWSSPCSHRTSSEARSTRLGCHAHRASRLAGDLAGERANNGRCRNGHRMPEGTAVARRYPVFHILTIQGAGIVLIGLDHQTAVLAGMFAIGFASGTASVLLSSAFQRTIDERHLGRVSSTARIGDLILLPVFTPAFSYLALRVGWVSRATAGQSTSLDIRAVIGTPSTATARTAPGSAASRSAYSARARLRACQSWIYWSAGWSAANVSGRRDCMVSTRACTASFWAWTRWTTRPAACPGSARPMTPGRAAGWRTPGRPGRRLRGCPAVEHH